MSSERRNASFYLKIKVCYADGQGTIQINNGYKKSIIHISTNVVNSTTVTMTTVKVQGSSLLTFRVLLER